MRKKRACTLMAFMFLSWTLTPAYADDPGRPHGITSDGSTGTTVSGAINYTISGGNRQGGNLFHSFGRLNIHAGESATFTDSGVNNTISRVTGVDYSWINGRLNSSAANFYLINPQGVTFGNNASLNTGSFHASTADYIRLGDGADRFYADLGSGSSLTAAPPEAFGFLGGNVKPISIDGAHLAVPEGETLSLAGGDVTISGGAEVTAPGGRLNIAAVNSAGEVIPGSNDLDTDTVSGMADITAQGSAVLDVSGTGAGRIFIRGGQFVLDDSRINANTLGDEDGGTVDVEAEEIALQEGAAITSETNGPGRGADIALKAGESITLSGKFDRRTAIRSASTSTGANAGDSGAILMEAKNITSENATVFAGTYGSGNSGDVTIRADESILFFMNPFNADIPLSDDWYDGVNVVTSYAGASGQSGDILIEARDISFGRGLLGGGPYWSDQKGPAGPGVHGSGHPGRQCFGIPG